jgi:hypothetical protein
MNTLLAFSFLLPTGYGASQAAPEHNRAGGDSTFNRLVAGTEPTVSKDRGVETWAARQPGDSLTEQVRSLLSQGRIAEARMLRNEPGVPPSLQRALEPPIARAGNGPSRFPQTDLAGAIRLAGSFPGEWVAVQGVAVVDHDRSPAALRQRLDANNLGDGVVVVRLPSDEW